ncbi:MAG: hypothetical protein HGA45_26080 [Chloroflexales bacterium]|nr:hypothetical protein [Chloroflexales bacterium]
MAKLSLWLITLAKGRPFSFLDHALRCGDSLLGIGDLEQLQFWALSEKYRDHRLDWVTGPVTKALSAAFPYRQDIRLQPTLDTRDADQKRDKLAKAEQAMALVRLGADLLVAAALAPDPRAREERRGRFLTRYTMLVRAAAEGRDTTALEADLRQDADALLQGRRPFHWPLEFPEVFAPSLQERPIEQMLAEAQTGTLSAETLSPGFSAVVGNPPFLGGTRISTMFGKSYLYGLQSVFPSFFDRTDICGLFFLRSYEVIQNKGTTGLVSTNTLTQGDTREASLEKIASSGGIVYRALNNLIWPGQAAVAVHVIHLTKGWMNPPFYLNKQPVEHISTSLEEQEDKGKPFRLVANTDKSFEGSKLIGIGFVLETNEAQRLIHLNEGNRDVLFPYLSGEDINTRPDQSPSRWVINFHDWPIYRAAEYPEPLQLVTERVKPERQRRKENGEFQLRKPLPERWWHYGDKRPALYSTIANKTKVLVIPRVSKYLNCSWQPVGIIYSDATVVIATDRNLDFVVLQNSIFEEWVRIYSSTLETRMRFTPTDCFETFPFPPDYEPGRQSAPGSRIPDPLDTIGERYHEHRKSIMLQRQEGMTKTYNRFHDPNEKSADIAELRRLHVEMDNAVAAAYGWADLELEHGFHETKQGLRYTISEAARREVLDRLLALNHERYAEEVEAGLHEKKGSGDRGQGSGKRSRKAAAQEDAPQALNAEPAAQLAFDLSEASPEPRTLNPDPSLRAEPRTLNPEPQTIESSPPRQQDAAYTKARELLAQRGSLSNGEVQAALGVDSEGARALLKRLVEEGVAAVVGQKRGTRYRKV